MPVNQPKLIMKDPRNAKFIPLFRRTLSHVLKKVNQAMEYNNK